MNKETIILDKNAPINKNKRKPQFSFGLNITKNMHINKPVQKIIIGNILSKGTIFNKNADSKAIKIIRLSFILVPTKHNYPFPGLY